ncbi:hypothetical protein [Paraburkholderia sp. J12]|uniref:hypothetical protein n=1 Tax=Paraburkholderia sp. J12 TaxID=2805432 RepID=UPI002ABD3B01|nr:hypothetical protein [Paraburkholderia sp. J12]
MNAIKMGLLGAAHPHTFGRLGSLLRTAKVELISGADDSGRPGAGAFFRHFRLQRMTESDILDDPSIEAVLICSASDCATRLAVRALQAGRLASPPRTSEELKFSSRHLVSACGVVGRFIARQEQINHQKERSWCYVHTRARARHPEPVRSVSRCMTGAAISHLPKIGGALDEPISRPGR